MPPAKTAPSTMVASAVTNPPPLTIQPPIPYMAISSTMASAPGTRRTQPPDSLPVTKSDPHHSNSFPDLHRPTTVADDHNRQLDTTLPPTQCRPLQEPLRRFTPTSHHKVDPTDDPDDSLSFETSDDASLSSLAPCSTTDSLTDDEAEYADSSLPDDDSSLSLPAPCPYLDSSAGESDEKLLDESNDDTDDESVSSTDDSEEESIPLADDDEDDESVPSLAPCPHVDSSDEEPDDDDSVDALDFYINLFLEANDPDKPLEEPILPPLTPKFFTDFLESSQASSPLPIYPSQAFRDFLDRYDSDQEPDDDSDDEAEQTVNNVVFGNTKSATATPPSLQTPKASAKKKPSKTPLPTLPRTTTPRSSDLPSSRPTGRKRSSAARPPGKKPSEKVYPWAYST